MVNPLYLLWWSLLLIVDFDSDTSTSWRVFFSWLDVVKGFFFTMARFLWSSTIVVLCGRPGLFLLLSSPVRPFFSECTKLLIWPLLMSLLSLWLICFVLKPKNSLFHLHGDLHLASFDHMTWVHSFQMQMADLKSNQNFYLLNWWRNNKGIAHNCPLNSVLVNFPITCVPLKRGEVHIKEL